MVLSSHFTDKETEAPGHKDVFLRAVLHSLALPLPSPHSMHKKRWRNRSFPHVIDEELGLTEGNTSPGITYHIEKAEL